MSIKKGDACPNENDPRWSILLSTVNNDKQDAVEAWTRNDYEFPEGWKLQSTKGWYEEARELRKLSVDELAEFIVSHTKESFSQKKISNSYWMKEFGDLGRATQKINKVNLQVRKELFKLHPIEGKYHKKSGNQMRILKTTDGRSIFKQISNKKQYQVVNQEGQVASEKTIRDLAARMSDRIGIPVRFQSDRTKKYKGKLENGTAVVNLAYATLDTPIHEILGHPIIRAIKNSNLQKPEINKDVDTFFNLDGSEYVFEKNTNEYFKDGKEINKDEFNQAILKVKELNSKTSKLYQNLLKELEYGRGKEVLDRIKRDYVNKEKSKSKNYNLIDKNNNSEIEIIQNFGNYWFKEYNETLTRGKQFNSNEELESLINKEQNKHLLGKYTLEEQQEEAIVELLGLMTAEKLNNTKDGKLISLLKRLLKEIKGFMKSLLQQREIDIDKLPDNMTLGDLADLLAYSNSKLILPGNEVIYTTPDNQQFKTYTEASKHISDLAKSIKDVDLSTINISYKDIIHEIPKEVDNFIYKGTFGEFGEIDLDLRVEKRGDGWYSETPYDSGFIKITNAQAFQFYTQDQSKGVANIKEFIQKNKEYEQSKEIIEEWKKVNNIQYNPEEIYSRGQEFSSVVGAYSSFDVNLMMQNLLQHIEDNEKAGGKFAISAYTKPVDKQIGHLEGGGGKIKFKIYPQSNDILWAANTDVYSGSVWDASEKVNKDKKSELLGVSYTKYPSLLDVSSVKPNLAAIVDELSHHHNELGISLTGSNFRLEYDEDIPYSTKKIINSINSILDQKYGKLVKPEIKKRLNKKDLGITFIGEVPNETGGSDGWWVNFNNGESKGFNTKKELDSYINSLQQNYATQPTQTNETLKESINDVKNRLDDRSNLLPTKFLAKGEEEGYSKDTWFYKENGEWYMKYVPYDAPFDTKVENYDITKLSHAGLSIEEVWASYLKTKPEGIENLQINNKEYTSQALINTKIAKLKEVAKKYPRSLIRSEVIPIKNTTELFSDEDDLPFQKVPNIEEEFLPQDPKIESAVKGIMSQLGIRLEAYDEYAQWYEMTYGKPLHAVGIADMLRGVIAIDKGRADKYTSLEELSHFILYALKDDKRVIEALSLIEGTEEWKNHSEAYIAEYDGDMEMVRLEILGKILKKQLGNEILDEKPIWKRRLELLWNRFLQFFNFGNKAREMRIKNSLDNIINDVIRGKTEKIRKGIQKGKGVFMQVEDSKKGSKDSKYEEFKKLFNNSKLLDSMDKELKESMKLIYDRLQDVKADGIESLIDREKKIYSKLVKDHADQKITRGIINYISHVEEGSDHIIKEVDRLRDEYDAGELSTDTVGFVKVLADMKKYISLYEDSVSGLIAKVRRHKHRTDSTDTTTDKVEALLNALLNIRSGMDVMKNTYEEYSKKLFMDTHRNLVMKDAFYATPEERNAKLADIESQLNSREDSMWPINAWVQAVAESKDDILMLTDRTYKQLDGLIRLESEDDSKTIINAFVEAQEAGMLDTEWMFERDDNGNITGNYITSVNHAMAEKAIHDFFVQLRKDFTLTQDPEVENIEFRIAELKNIVSELESGKRKPSLDVNSPTQVTNADEYFGGSMITASGSSASKEKTIEYFNNRIAYLEKNKEKSYTKREAHMRRVIERSHMADTPELLAYNKKIAQFFTDNFEKNPEWQKIYQDKRDSVYREILPLKKDRETVQRLKDTYGKDKWQSKLIEENRDLALKVKRAEKILNEWRNERRVEVSFDGKTVMSYRREFALPKQSIYGNSAFTDAMKDPVKKKFYDAWLKMRTEKVAHMTPEYRYSTLMPQIRKDTLERLKTDPTKTATELMKDAFTVRADETERGRIDATGQKVKQVPLFFMNPLEDMNELSLDATATMIAFADTANRHRYLSRMVDTAEMTADILRTRKLYKKSGELSTTGGNPYRMYREYIDMRLYGEWKKTETWEGYDMGKMADALNRYSAMSTLALNAFAGISNVVLGNSLIRQEAFANEFVDHKDVMYADTVYWDVRNGVTDLMGDVGKLRSNNKLRLFIERFNLLRDHKERMRDVNADRSRFGRMFDMSAFFFVNHAGEHQMQSRLGLALAHKKKVLNEKGEEIPFYEAFDVENYKLILKEGMKNLDGSPITNEDFESFMTKAGHINNKLHGIYNDADKAMYQRYAIGRIVGLYRKWLAPGINRRWKGRYHDWILETDVEGFYTTAISFFKQLFLELRQGQFTFASIGTNYDKLKDFEKANLARALGEVAMMMIALAAAVLLEMFAEAIDDDDEYAAWAVNMSAYQANRYFTETMFYLPVLGTLEQLKIINSPAAAVDQISHIMSIGKIIDPFGALIEGDDIFPRYERGRHKNDLKAYVWGRDMVPLASTVEDFFYPEDRLKYFSN